MSVPSNHGLLMSRAVDVERLGGLSSSVLEQVLVRCSSQERQSQVAWGDRVLLWLDAERVSPLPVSLQWFRPLMKRNRKTTRDTVLICGPGRAQALWRLVDQLFAVSLRASQQVESRPKEENSDLSNTKQDVRKYSPTEKLLRKLRQAKTILRTLAPSATLSVSLQFHEKKCIQAKIRPLFIDTTQIETLPCLQMLKGLQENWPQVLPTSGRKDVSADKLVYARFCSSLQSAHLNLEDIFKVLTTIKGLLELQFKVLDGGQVKCSRRLISRWAVLLSVSNGDAELLLKKIQDQGKPCAVIRALVGIIYVGLIRHIEQHINRLLAGTNPPPTCHSVNLFTSITPETFSVSSLEGALRNKAYENIIKVADDLLADTEHRNQCAFKSISSKRECPLDKCTEQLEALLSRVTVEQKRHDSSVVELSHSFGSVQYNVPKMCESIVSSKPLARALVAMSSNLFLGNIMQRGVTEGSVVTRYARDEEELFYLVRPETFLLVHTLGSASLSHDLRTSNLSFRADDRAERFYPYRVEHSSIFDWYPSLQKSQLAERATLPQDSPNCNETKLLEDWLRTLIGIGKTRGHYKVGKRKLFMSERVMCYIVRHAEVAHMASRYFEAQIAQFGNKRLEKIKKDKAFEHIHLSDSPQRLGQAFGGAPKTLIKDSDSDVCRSQARNESKCEDSASSVSLEEYEEADSSTTGSIGSETSCLPVPPHFEGIPAGVLKYDLGGIDNVSTSSMETPLPPPPDHGLSWEPVIDFRQTYARASFGDHKVVSEGRRQSERLDSLTEDGDKCVQTVKHCGTDSARYCCPLHPEMNLGELPPCQGQQHICELEFNCGSPISVQSSQHSDEATTRDPCSHGNETSCSHLGSSITHGQKRASCTRVSNLRHYFESDFGQDVELGSACEYPSPLLLASDTSSDSHDDSWASPLPGPAHWPAWGGMACPSPAPPQTPPPKSLHQVGMKHHTETLCSPGFCTSRKPYSRFEVCPPASPPPRFPQTTSCYTTMPPPPLPTTPPPPQREGVNASQNTSWTPPPAPPYPPPWEEVSVIPPPPDEAPPSPKLHEVKCRPSRSLAVSPALEKEHDPRAPRAREAHICTPTAVKWLKRGMAHIFTDCDDTTRILTFFHTAATTIQCFWRSIIARIRLEGIRSRREPWKKLIRDNEAIIISSLVLKTADVVKQGGRRSSLDSPRIPWVPSRRSSWLGRDQADPVASPIRHGPRRRRSLVKSRRPRQLLYTTGPFPRLFYIDQDGQSKGDISYEPCVTHAVALSNTEFVIYSVPDPFKGKTSWSFTIVPSGQSCASAHDWVDALRHVFTVKDLFSLPQGIFQYKNWQPVIKQGMLMKQSTFSKASWRERYFELRLGTLEWFRCSGDAQSRGCLILDEHTRVESGTELYSLEIVHPQCVNTSIKLRARNDTTFGEWIDALNHVVTLHTRRSSSMTALERTSS